MNKHLTSAKPLTVKDAVSAIKDYRAEKLSGKTHIELHKAASEFISANQVSDAIRVIAKEFDGLQFDFERAEDDVFYTAPPLEQLAGIAEGANLDANDLIDRIEKAQQQIQEYQNFEDDANASGQETNLERPLHLMTAHRAKGKEFDTVILLDTVEGIWPHGKTDDQRKMEAERRLFYVAFTRARKKVVMLTDKNAGPISSFMEELNLAQQPEAGM